MKLTIKTHYGVIPNFILNNESLSLKAKGLFAFIQAKPDGWSFSVERISSQTKDGTTAIREGLKELEECGLLIREPMRNEQGKWVGYDYILSENSSADKRTTDKRPTKNMIAISKQDNSKQEDSNIIAIAKEQKRKETKPLITHFCIKYNDIFSKPYIPSYSKDGACIKRLLSHGLTFEVISGAMDRFLTDDDVWLANKGRTIGIFTSRINQYITNENKVDHLDLEIRS